MYTHTHYTYTCTHVYTHTRVQPFVALEKSIEKHALDEEKVEQIGRTMLVVLQDCILGLAYLHDSFLSLGVVPMRDALAFMKRSGEWRGVLCDFARVAKCAHVCPCVCVCVCIVRAHWAVHHERMCVHLHVCMC